MSTVLIALAIAILAVSVWALANRPEQEPPWPPRIQGFSFSPLHEGQSPLEKIYPDESDIESDLALLEGKTHAIRTYTVEDKLFRIPEMAKKYHLNVAFGVWIDGNHERNRKDMQIFLETAARSTNIVRAVVGNEAILRGELTPEELAVYLDEARAALDVPVSTAEPWHVWVKYHELAEHVDYIAVHMLPYWEGVHIDRAVDFVVEKIDLLKELFPGKPIIIAEVGWPSNGRTRQSAVASPANQAVFLRRFLDRAQQENYIYYIMEAFDQPWKRDTEGAVGAYWGVYDVARQEKFPFTRPIVPIPNWTRLAGLSVFIALITFAVLLIDSHSLSDRGRGFLAVLVFAAASGAVWVVYDYIHQYLTVGTVIVGLVMISGMIGVIVVLLTEAHEWAEARWIIRLRRSFRPVTLDDDQLPMVSIHVPAYNEPPEMVIDTLNALATLDYPRFEVLVVDNNTRDSGVWKPVAEHCHSLGARFRFFHVNPLAGFKAGALNFALSRTNAAAQIIAVIDSDYQVAPNWLRDLVPQFKEPKVGIVQAPQDYRDGELNAFKSMCYAEYRGFFFIGMVTRNERNAIIQHGTMTLIRRSVLESIDGWSEWSITEDAELGLRIFEHGYEAAYIPRSYGRGLMPDTFADYKKQRYRWAYGAVQILRRHAKFLSGSKKSQLRNGQRYHFIAGWLPWLADGANLFFNVAALLWSLAMIIDPLHIDPPLVIFSILPLALFTFKIGKVVYLYRTRVNATLAQTVAAAAAGLALSHTIANAVLAGFVTRDKPFYRTPKMAKTGKLSLLTQSLMVSLEEIFLLAAMLSAATTIGLLQKMDTLDMNLWVIVLVVQALPYAATLLVALVSGFPWMRGRFLHWRPQQQETIKTVANSEG
ncbi:glycosyltransferase family 2 protein [Desulfosarcina ovata]|uniref:Beta-monoglucosyldiacylglycerol synthase n=1 Tax=Desulfosarcina ovata subsp. ovata TaxID=2752305 RepID=A0A5K8A5Y4_9BACT|nr:glycosyltransferase [Desulfosarcina ovata]BBO87917.1 glycosyl transferase [Desulfosarcina ovata subsp. ovata]